MAHPVKFKFGKLQRAWLRALESGKYRQAKGTLRETRITAGGNTVYSYCCLGVANVVCKLGETDEGTLANTHHKLGLRSQSGGSKDFPLFQPLTTLNDEGVKDGTKMTFRKIAAVLRKNPEQYFNASA